MRVRNRKQSKNGMQHVYVVIAYLDTIDRIEGVYSTNKAALRKRDRLYENCYGRDKHIAVLEMSVRGTVLIGNFSTGGSLIVSHSDV